ncbi:MAG: carbamoyltransferase HypF, partial [Candidatus Melainabacteria bacterium]|nr:carbamoyltransferase HypF [Candidatus Melainabacteria bacterium]
YGIVQGVGFRPFVYNLACSKFLSGFVRNTCSGVAIEVQGPARCVADFLDLLKTQAPPLAKIEHLITQEVPCCLNLLDRFYIQDSNVSLGDGQAIPPDTATCNECLQELFDSANRRYRYPFINCTGCGPRFSIIKALPYDRASTTMDSFQMCKQCAKEYHDPSNRRFHAQPNACWVCGPKLAFHQTNPQPTFDILEPELAIDATISHLKTGHIVAVKGLGGFHLLCDASNEDAVIRLRQRKGRYAKPLAVMMLDIEMVRQFCVVNLKEKTLLLSTQRPIVLLKKLPSYRLANSVAPNINHLGVMLPYTPLHHILLTDFNAPLVATSGNQSEEPIAIDNQEAITSLAHIADAFLVHNRLIKARYDDSVAKVFNSVELVLRRSRGYAPLPIELSFATRVPVLACGGQLKNTFCLVDKNKAFVSQHIGDLENEESLQHFHDSLNHMCTLFSIKPEVIAHDLHPDYLSTAAARQLAHALNIPTIGVQHHHAHIVSCMAEHHINQPVIGVAFDGLGYGTDGTAWGGEFLVCTWSNFERKAYFQPVPLPGGTQAIKNPWRTALGYILGIDRRPTSSFAPFIETLRADFGQETIAVVEKQIAKCLNAPLTSSCGRLFDAMAALIGVCRQASYEAQAAMQLEALATDDKFQTNMHYPKRANLYPYQLTSIGCAYVIEPRPILESAFCDLQNGVSTNSIAARFHHTIVDIVLEVCRTLRLDTGIETVCLSGGVFQNTYLLQQAVACLQKNHFQVFIPQKLPTNDGGLSLGQAVSALANLNLIEYM